MDSWCFAIILMHITSYITHTSHKQNTYNNTKTYSTCTHTTSPSGKITAFLLNSYRFSKRDEEERDGSGFPTTILFVSDRWTNDHSPYLLFPLLPDRLPSSWDETFSLSSSPTAKQSGRKCTISIFLQDCTCASSSSVVLSSVLLLFLCFWITHSRPHNLLSKVASMWTTWHKWFFAWQQIIWFLKEKWNEMRSLLVLWCNCSEGEGERKWKFTA